MSHKRESAPTVQSKRASVQEHQPSISQWERGCWWLGAIAIIGEFAVFAMVVTS